MEKNGKKRLTFFDFRLIFLGQIRGSVLRLEIKIEKNNLNCFSSRNQAATDRNK